MLKFISRLAKERRKGFSDFNSDLFIILEPTSLNVDNIELDSDDCDEASSTKEKVAKLEEGLFIAAPTRIVIQTPKFNMFISYAH